MEPASPPGAHASVGHRPERGPGPRISPTTTAARQAPVFVWRSEREAPVWRCPCGREGAADGGGAASGTLGAGGTGSATLEGRAGLTLGGGGAADRNGSLTCADTGNTDARKTTHTRACRWPDFMAPTSGELPRRVHCLVTQQHYTNGAPKIDHVARPRCDRTERQGYRMPPRRHAVTQPTKAGPRRVRQPRDHCCCAPEAVRAVSRPRDHRRAQPIHTNRWPRTDRGLGRSRRPIRARSEPRASRHQTSGTPARRSGTAGQECPQPKSQFTRVTQLLPCRASEGISRDHRAQPGDRRLLCRIEYLLRDRCRCQS